MIARSTLLLGALGAVLASPAVAATGPFVSLRNTDFVVLLGFLLFVGILLYFRVPSRIGKMLDTRAEGIRADLAEARRLRDEAQEIYASYERRQRDVAGQADEIVANAKREATAHAAKAKTDLEDSIQRRLKAAEDQIASAESDAVRAVRDRAVQVAIAAASEVLAAQSGASDRSAGIDRAIDNLSHQLN
ncbi:F0F1 ATP synthase subunit B [Paracoccus marinus]|uniref:F0F1 ATP synthase subunit B n=1 Tax=Paracoccus marinus TaxID=288426 RepID=UPI00103C0685|nr:F0F1 ATP synthase subunit B [Paracoccus marinus]GLS81929.1 ATP synthase subunit b 1 [Paracoccus marinus]